MRLISILFILFTCKLDHIQDIIEPKAENEPIEKRKLRMSCYFRFV